jgi:hypothetical protein
MTGQGAFNSVIANFNDGTEYFWTENPDNTYMCMTYSPPPPNKRPFGSTMNFTMDQYNKSNGRMFMTSTMQFPVFFADFVTMQVAVFPPGTDSFVYTAEPIIIVMFNQVVILYATMATLPRPAAQISLPTYGTISTGLLVATIGKFLADARRTPNMALFALNGDGYIIGNAIPGDDGLGLIPYSRIPATGTKPLGCANVTNWDNFTAPPELACLVRADESSFAPLRSVPLSVLNTSTSRVERIDLDENYFVAVARVPMRIPGLQVQLVLLLPEKDVIGDVVKSQNIAIGVSAAVVVVMAVASFVFIVVMLAPLDDVAERMLLAATFQPEAEPLKMSAMQEVRHLQSAYKQMSTELNRIRSFVPQSVLQAGQAGGLSDFDDEDQHSTMKRALTSTTPRRTCRTRRSWVPAATRSTTTIPKAFPPATRSARRTRKHLLREAQR